MIKQLAVLAVAATCLMASTCTAGPVTKEEDVAVGQKRLFSLLSHIYIRNFKLESEIYEIVHGWDIDADHEDERWQAAVSELSKRFKSGILPRGTLFSVYYPHLLEEAVLIFEALFHAPTSNDFLSIVYWGHKHLNEHQFNYALSVALMHHPKSTWMPLWKPYQIVPEYFFNTDVMKQIWDFKMDLINHAKIEPEVDTFTVRANYSNWYINDLYNSEHKLSYFMEDIGLNTWYYNFNQKYPFWMSSEKHSNLTSSLRGEIYFWTLKMFLTRYNLERLSHNLDEVEYLNWKQPIETGYTPFMTYFNGMHFPKRQEFSTVPIWKNEYLEYLEEYESRIAAVADSGYVMTKEGKLERIANTPEGINIFANLVLGNNESINRPYYGSIDASGRHVLSFSPEPHNDYQILPGSLQHFTTSLRDPGFYRLINKIVGYNFRYQKHLDHYTQEQLGCKGVEVKSASIVEKDLHTFFEEDVKFIEQFNYFNQQNEGKVVKILTRQERLNHKPYTYSLNLHAEEAIEVSIRIFLGSKYDVHGKETLDSYKNYYEVDYFTKELVKGENIFTRKSTATPWFAPDHTTEKLGQVVAESQQAALYRSRFGFPQRFLLPKGQVEGMPVQFFIHVSKFEANPDPGVEPFLMYRDKMPLGFPLDRPIYNFNMPNMKFVEVKIFHEESVSHIVNESVPK